MNIQDIPWLGPFLGNLVGTKKPRRHQRYFMLCEDLVVEKVSLPIETGYGVDEESSQAWHLIHNLLLPMKGEKYLYQVVSERNAVPLSPFDGNTEAINKLTEITPIAREEFYKQLSDLEKQGKKNLLASAIRFAILCISVLFALVVLMTMLQSGSVKMPI